jgi:ribulose bisphosphate carboxylase small subunit
MLAQGVPLVKVMAIVGHKKMETTDIYLRLAGVDVKGATEALGYSVPKPSGENVISIHFGKS